MVNPVEILKDENGIKRFHNSTEEVTVKFERNIVIFNEILFEEYNIKKDLTKFSKMVQVDGCQGGEYELCVFETSNSDGNNGLISSEGNPFIICYADEAAKIFGFEKAEDFIEDVRRREQLYEDCDYDDESDADDETDDDGIFKAFESSNVSNVIQFAGTMTFRNIKRKDESDILCSSYSYGVLVIKCESEIKLFYISTGGWKEDEKNYYLGW